MKAFSWISSLIFLLYVSHSKAENRQSRQITLGNLQGICRYGNRLECCYGWKKNSKGQCEAQCEFGCKHGECVGPNKCKCFPGYTGRTCSQDLNECGLKPRPCEHRCMNTFGSYMCYCLNGYMLMPDGTCANSRTCLLAHCQYGCEEVEGEIRCICPSTGLQLSPDGKTCVDIDECVSQKHQCPYNRECVNTFGSYYCKCQTGYDLKYINGKYDCVDINECADSTANKCDRHADCINTDGSYKCKCKQGFRGNGFDCSVKPFYSSSRSSWDGGDKGSADEFQNVIPDSPSKFRILGEKLDNTIPEALVTESPKLHLQPFDYDGEVYIGPEEPQILTEGELEEEQDRGVGGEEKNGVNSEKLKPRGDVFFPGEVYGRVSELKEINAAPLYERFLTDCGFDSGECEWVQEKDDDLDWSVHYHQKGKQYYMALSGIVGNWREKARLKLLLTDRVRQGSFCLKFSYQITEQQTGSLRIIMENANSDYVLWETRFSADEWQSDNIDVVWTGQAPDSIVFEGTRGNSGSGEIGLDNVVLISGSCHDDEETIF
ncbi:epidermal growth factor-like protein 6 [Trichomycterus rosablanca]|uniref:epidermal growth factor-like protein 6 n=1 Tax=Trichomycterus rosablanca TaxID=2290929 RepID=UPI002F360D1C